MLRPAALLVVIAGCPSPTVVEDLPCTIDNECPEPLVCSKKLCIQKPLRVTHVSAGDSHTCALLDNSRVVCWGSGQAGQLGLGNLGHVYTASADGWVTLNDDAIAIAAADRHTCAALQTGALHCWGANEYQQLGYDAPSPVLTPSGTVNVVADDSSNLQTVQIAVAARHSCARFAAGTLRCWGAADERLGYDDTTTNNVPPRSHGDLPIEVTHACAAELFSCAVTPAGFVRCWGEDNDGRLGFMTSERQTAATTQNLDLGEAAEQVACTETRACAVMTSGAIKCWGTASNGLFGLALAGQQKFSANTETPSVPLPAPAIQIALGPNHSCALLANGDVFCWGQDSQGQLGYGAGETVGDDETPMEIGPVPLPDRAVQISIGESHSCAVLESGKLLCWGDNRLGKLGQGCTQNPDTMEYTCASLGLTEPADTWAPLPFP